MALWSILQCGHTFWEYDDTTEITNFFFICVTEESEDGTVYLIQQQQPTTLESSRELASRVEEVSLAIKDMINQAPFFVSLDNFRASANPWIFIEILGLLDSLLLFLWYVCIYVCMYVSTIYIFMNNNPLSV